MLTLSGKESKQYFLTVLYGASLLVGYFSLIFEN